MNKISTAGFSEPQPADQTLLDALSSRAAQLGRNIVDVAGFLDGLAGDADRQHGLIRSVEAAASRVADANAQVAVAAEDATSGARQALGVVEGSVDRMRDASQRTRNVAQWVHELSARMEAVEAALKRIEHGNGEISSIAKQVNILAINAKIEASRAGEAGRGFAFLADTVNELSQRTATTAATIVEGIAELNQGIGALKREAGDISGVAETVLSDALETDTLLTGISAQIRQTGASTRDIAERSEEVARASAQFGPVFGELMSAVGRTSGALVDTRKRVNGMIDDSEFIVQSSVGMGANSTDGMYIDAVLKIAADISAAFERGVATGQISQMQLFTHQYRPVPGSNPEQVMAPFTAFTDRVLPPIQEAALKLSDKIVFCAAVDPNGYLPTHNLKFSQPQGQDPVWNAANCRNRRIFNDRVGLKAGRSTAPFLLQVYRRDMGGGEFVMMKDLSAPIKVAGRHWGGVRLAYKF